MLCLSLKQDEPVCVTHEGKVLWLAVRFEKGKIRAYISGPSEMVVSRPMKHGQEQPAPESFERLFHNGNRGRN